MRPCIVYSSETGNTKMVAESVAKALHIPLYAVDDDFDTASYDCFILGFWVLRGLPDPKMRAFIERLCNVRVFFFATHAAWVESEHVRKCKEATANLLALNRNTLLGCFTCQGRVQFRKRSHHPMTDERRVRLEEAAKHPNQEDCDLCICAVQNVLDGV